MELKGLAGQILQWDFSNVFGIALNLKLFVWKINDSLE